MVRCIYRFDELFINHILLNHSPITISFRFHSKLFVDRFVGSGIYNLFDLILSGQEDRERKREEEEKKIDTRRTL